METIDLSFPFKLLSKTACFLMLSCTPSTPEHAGSLPPPPPPIPGGDALVEALRPVPEYAPVGQVLLSAMALQAPYAHTSLLKALVATGTPLTILFDPSDLDSLGQAKAALKPWLARGKGSQPKAVADGPSLNQNPQEPHSFAADYLAVPHSDIWLRDFSPQFLISAPKDGKGAQRIARGWHYLNREAKDESAARAIALGLGASSWHPSHLQLDGGNLLYDEQDCLMAADNLGARLRGPHESNYRQTLRHHLGCEKTIMIYGAPHAHIDMWAKVVAPHVVLVNEVSPELRQYLWAEQGALYRQSEEIAKALDFAAMQIAASGRKVIRLPMPTPLPLLWRSYANSLLVNGHALVPRFRTSQMPGVVYPDQSELSQLEHRVEKIYQDSGFAVHWVEADSYIRRGGAMHCITASLPRLSLKSWQAVQSSPIPGKAAR